MGNNIPQEFKEIKSLHNTPDEYFTHGRKVRVIRNERYVKYIQSQCNGWENSMLKCLNNVYMVISVDADKGIILKSAKKINLLFNRAALEPIEDDIDFHEEMMSKVKMTESFKEENANGFGKIFGKLWKHSPNVIIPSSSKSENNFPYSVGDEVKLSSDESKFKELQKDVGGYAKLKMQHILGRTVIIKYICNRYIKVDWREEDYDIHPELILRESPINLCTSNECMKNDSSEANFESIPFKSNEETVPEETYQEKKCHEFFEYIEVGDIWNINKDINVDLINSKGPQGMTPVNRACYLGKFDIVKEFVSFGADTNIPDDEGRLPIHNAIKFNHEEIFLYLLNYEIDAIQKLTSDGKSLLHIAKIENRKNIIKILMDANVNIHILDTDGKRASYYNNDSDINPQEEIIKTEERIIPEDTIVEFTQPIPTIIVQNECEICKDRIKNVTFLFCGHTACSECSDQITKCHMCKAEIIQKFKVYL